jgi:bifunctional non-homologous end joining protein LigD
VNLLNGRGVEPATSSQRSPRRVTASRIDAEALIDGEAVVFRDDNCRDFHARLTKLGGAQASLVAFDLLRLGGDDLRQRPLEKRREALARLIAKRRSDGILFSEAIADDDSAVVFAKACELGLEGIALKRTGSFYRCGRSRNWLKTKNPDFVGDAQHSPRTS